MTATSNQTPQAVLAGVQTPRIGLGCMGMSEFYSQQDERHCTHVLQLAHEMGYRHFDTADMYGRGANETLLRRLLDALGSARHEVLVATKVGIKRPVSGLQVEVDSSPAYIRQACEQSLCRLGVERIGLLYLHRKSAAIPIEDSVGALQDLVKEGKVGHIGLSEVSAATLERACRIAPIAALQSEYSLWTRDPEQAVLDVCARYGVALIAYSPLGRGFLTGRLDSQSMAGQGDIRQKLPRFQAGNIERNAALLATLERIALELSCQPAQVALAWVLARSPMVHAIPGSTRSTNLRANLEAQHITLPPAHKAHLDKVFSPDAIAGERYPQALLHTVNI